MLRTLIFCIIVGLLCGLLGAAFNALNIQVGRPPNTRRLLVRLGYGRLGASGHGVEIQMVQRIDVRGPRWAAGGFGFFDPFIFHLSHIEKVQSWGFLRETMGNHSSGGNP